MISEKAFREFLVEISQLEPLEFLGVAEVLCVKLADEDRDRTYDEILSDVMDRFIMLGRAQRRELMSTIKKANIGRKS